MFTLLHLYQQHTANPDSHSSPLSLRSSAHSEHNAALSTQLQNCKAAPSPPRKKLSLAKVKVHAQSTEIERMSAERDHFGGFNAETLSSLATATRTIARSQLRSQTTETVNARVASEMASVRA